MGRKGGIHISSEQFCNAFPYHIIFDSELQIKQCGMMIQRLLRVPITDQFMGNLFELIHPRMEMGVINIRMFINAVFMLKVIVPIKTQGQRSVLLDKATNGEKPNLILKGKAS